jgi:imidazoleglycerol-phosphate dehydratase
MKKRTAIIKRKTKETDIAVKLNIDGSGKSKIDTGIGILDHMLELFAFWGLFDLDIKAKGDLKVDIHHTNEDIGIVLGEAFKKALGTKKGISRLGSASVPMEEVVANVTADISGRAYYKLNAGNPNIIFTVPNPEGQYSFEDAGHFFESLATHLGMNMNVLLNNPSADLHKTLEPVFKALGIALDRATKIDPRRIGVPSTKGVID